MADTEELDDYAGPLEDALLDPDDVDAWLDSADWEDMAVAIKGDGENTP